MADRQKIFQYLIRAQPILVPQITALSGGPDTILLVRDVLVQYQVSAFVPLVATVATDWIAQHPTPPKVPPRPQSDGTLAPFQPPVVTVFLDWDVQDPAAPILRPRLLTVVDPPPFQPGTEITRVDWLAQSPPAPKGATRPLTEGTIAPFQPPVAPTIFLDWDVAPPDLRRAARPPATSGVLAPFQPGSEPGIAWQVPVPDPRWVVTRPIVAGILAPFQPPAAVVALDWQIEQPAQPLPARPAAQGLWAAPSWVPDVTTPAPTLSWQGYQPAQIWPRTRPFPPALQQTLAASPTMFQSVPPAAVIAGQISVDYPEMPTNMSGGAMLGGVM